MDIDGQSTAHTLCEKVDFGGGIMRRIIIAVVAAITAAAGIVAVQLAGPTSAGAAPCVQIYRIYYNSPGTDTGSNTSLNAEFISLHNTCATARPMTSWKIKDAANHTYPFGTYSIGGGQYVRVHTGKGTNTAADRYWGSGSYIWNNDKDTASLYNQNGTLLDRCSYNNPAASQKYC
jgi:Lamin Tail Domain